MKRTKTNRKNETFLEWMYYIKSDYYVVAEQSFNTNVIALDN